MKSKFAIITLCLLLLLAIVQASSSIDLLRKKRTVCAFGQRLCGTRCYGGSQQCLGGSVVCDFSQRLCGTRCYGGSQQCLGGTVVCDFAQRLCGTRCYGGSQQCLGGGVVCDFGQRLCAEAINRSFNEIKSYVENRRHNLLQSLKTTQDHKLKILNDQLNLILNEKSKIEQECAIFQEACDIHILTQRIQELNDRIERMSVLGEPRENSFMKFEFRHNQALQDLARSLNSVGRIRVSSTYPPLCRAKIEPAVANLQCAIHIETVDYNGNVRIDGGDPLTVNIWDPYGKLCEYNFHDKQSGTYTIIFRPLISGNHKIDIRIFDRPISGSPFTIDVTKHNNPLWSFGKRGRGDNELSMPVSVIVDDSAEREQVYVLDPGNSRIKLTDTLLESTSTGLAYRSSTSKFYLLDWKSKLITEFSIANSDSSSNENSQITIHHQITCSSFNEPVQIAVCEQHQNSLLICDNNTFLIVDSRTGDLINKIDTRLFGIKTIKGFTIGLQDEIIVGDHRIHILSYEGKYLRQISSLTQQ
ncbi:unnamed protein product [Adineta steineri]|nr:unnamed protein product [Adineta steineri]CAF0757429.1 unnamed protein product [Adineta steineri]